MLILAPGRLFRAVYPGTRGEGKPRPMIIMNRSVDIRRTREVIAVVCTTSFALPIEPDEVRLPFDPEGRCVTRLKQDTVAVCNWTTTYPADQIQETTGVVPGNLLREICEKAGFTYTPDR